MLLLVFLVYKESFAIVKLTVRTMGATFLIILSLLHLSSSRVCINGDTGKDGGNCLIGSWCCKSLEYFSSMIVDNCSNLSVSIDSSNLYLSKVIIFTNCNVSIFGKGMDSTKIQCIKNSTESSSGFLFRNNWSIFLSNVSIDGCAFKLREDKQAVAMYVAHDVKIISVLIVNSDGIGLSLQNTSNVLIQNSSFINNVVKDASAMGGGGVSIYLYDYIMTSSVLQQHRCIISIINCNFISNSAYNSYNSNKAHLYGGALYIALSHVTNFLVHLKDCNFTSNIALSGGALFIHIKYAQSNHIVLSNLLFDSNRAPYFDGGALNIVFGSEYTNQPGNNVFSVEHNVFMGNKAHVGGAVALLIPRSSLKFVNDTIYDKISFINNKFIKNSASASAAIDINRYSLQMSRDIFMIRISFDNCTFHDNFVVTKKTSYIDRGVVFSAGVSITFGNATYFQNNYGSALCIAGTTVIFRPHSSTSFINNTGHHGGAMLLLEKSTLNVNHSTLLFYGNTAYLGGAICVIPTHTDILFEIGECVFWRYNNLTLNYNENVSNYSFSRNTALSGIGNDIFIASLKSCSKFFHTYKTSSLFLKRYLGNFQFSSSFNESVATAPYVLQLRENSSIINLFPGIPFQMSVLQLDEFNKTVGTYFPLSAKVKDKHKPVIFYSNNDTYCIVHHGQPGTNDSVIIESTDFSNVFLEISVKFLKCPPGYYFENDTCFCGSRYYQGIAYCVHNASASIISGQWAGYVNDTFVTAFCSIYLCSYPHSVSLYSMHYLPLERKLLNDFVCHAHRRGTLCGQCESSFTTYYHSPDYICGSASSCQFGALYFILSEILPVTAIFLFIALFNVNLSHGAFYSFILYSQILNNMFVSAYPIVPFGKPLRIIMDFYKVFYGIFSFDILELDVISYCVTPNASVLDMLLFKYFTTFYALCLIITTALVLKFNSLYSCVKLCHMFGRRNVYQSVINGLTAFLILCYFRCLVITFQILFPVSLLGTDNEILKTVPLYNGNLTFLKGSHLKYAVPALLVFIFIILPPPVILIAEPLLITLSGRFVVRNVALKYFLQKTRLNLKPFLDSFQGCFRDDCRCFAGLFFLYRVAMVPGKLILNIAWGSSINVAILVLIILLHSLYRPFQMQKHNNIDIFLLINILFVNFGAVLQCFLFIREPEYQLKDNQIIFSVIVALQVILIALPLLSFLFYSVSSICFKKRELSPNWESSSIFPHRLTQNNNYGSIQ